jgi:hypothetical protein
MATSRRTTRQTGQSSRNKNRSPRASARRNGNGHGSHSNYYGLGSTMRKAVSSGRDAMNTAYERASEMTGSLPSMRDMRHMMPSTPRGLQDMVNRNPMRLGAIGIGLGLLLGALVPFMMMDQQNMFSTSGRSSGSLRQSRSRSSGRRQGKSQVKSRSRRTGSQSRSSAPRSQRSPSKSRAAPTTPTSSSANRPVNAAGRSES